MKWFKHDADANRDPKLEKVLMKYGAEGYALYWLCLELIAAPIDKHNISFELEHDAEILAYRLRMDSARVEEIMRFMVSQELFEISTTSQRVCCMKLALRIENSVVKHPELKQIQQDIKSSRKIPDNPGKVRPDIDTDIDKDTDKNNTTDSRLDDLKRVFPKRAGSQPWAKASKAINARIRGGSTWDEIIAGAERYAVYCAATDRVGTEFVMQAATFCGPDKHFLEDWQPPATKSERRQDKNIEAALQFLEDAGAD